MGRVGPAVDWAWWGPWGSDGSLWVRLRVRVRMGGLHGTRRGEGSRELCACAGHQMLCYVIGYVCIERVLGRRAAGRGGVSGGRVIGYVCE